MTALKIIANPDMDRLLIAGRKAAAVALLIEAHDKGLPVTGPTMDAYDGKCQLLISNLDIGPAVDAAVIEAMVQIAWIPARRPWWKFWA